MIDAICQSEYSDNPSPSGRGGVPIIPSFHRRKDWLPSFHPKPREAHNSHIPLKTMPTLTREQVERFKDALEDVAKFLSINTTEAINRELQAAYAGDISVRRESRFGTPNRMLPHIANNLDLNAQEKMIHAIIAGAPANQTHTCRELARITCQSPKTVHEQLLRMDREGFLVVTQVDGGFTAEVLL